MKTIFAMFLTSCLTISVNADCYRQNDCLDDGREAEFRAGQFWTPRKNPCYRCQCYKAKRYVLGCQEPIDQPVVNSVKKSAIFAKLYKLPNHPHDEDVEISKAEASSIICKPVPGPTFNWKTWSFEFPTLKNVYFYYTELHSQCCSRFISIKSSDPSCETIKVSKCKTRLVQKNDHTKPCMGPQSFVG